jgi:hypothetical protein
MQLEVKMIFNNKIGKTMEIHKMMLNTKKIMLSVILMNGLLSSSFGTPINLDKSKPASKLNSAENQTPSVHYNDGHLEPPSFYIPRDIEYGHGLLKASIILMLDEAFKDSKDIITDDSTIEDEFYFMIKAVGLVSNALGNMTDSMLKRLNTIENEGSHLTFNSHKLTKLAIHIKNINSSLKDISEKITHDFEMA